MPPEGGASTTSHDGASLTALLGTFERGDGAAGLALLLTLEDVQGPVQWAGELRDARGEVAARFLWFPERTRAWTAQWWGATPASSGSRYVVMLKDEAGRSVELEVALATSAGLEVPDVQLDATGETLSWAPVPEAASYECAVAGALQRPSGSTCVVPTAPGAHEALVRAFSVDLSGAELPLALPRSFDVAERRLAWSTSTSGMRLRGGLGTISFSSGAEGLAAVASVQLPDGGAPATAWDIEVRGPALGSSGVMAGTQLARTDRLILWTYDVRPREGTYEVRATDGTETLTLALPASLPEFLAAPTGIRVESRGSGGAVASWGAVAGARGYFVSVWSRSSGALLASNWTTETSATFAPGTFPLGEACDAYVAASSVDPRAGTPVPSSVSVSENTYSPVSFTSR